jgi:hypothetical protein
VNYRTIIDHYEKCLEAHGDSYLGVDWTRPEQVEIRYQAMLDVIRHRDASEGMCTLLDFGCGCSHLYEYILKKDIKNISYSGHDISNKFIALSSAKFPHLPFYAGDILSEGNIFPEFDYIVMNGVFTEKRELTFEEMFRYFKGMIRAVFPKVRKGLAFNAMSKHVDWERDDLFHLPFDVLVPFLRSDISRHFVIRNDYGLHEYTVYVFTKEVL